MANKKISQLTELPTSEDTDIIAVVDVSEGETGETKKQMKGDFLKEVSWVIDYTPAQTVNGSNTVFTLPEDASRVVVYADGIRVKGGGFDYTFSSNDTITFVSGRQPYATLSIDYLPS